MSTLTETKTFKTRVSAAVDMRPQYGFGGIGISLWFVGSIFATAALLGDVPKTERFIQFGGGLVLAVFGVFWLDRNMRRKRAYWSLWLERLDALRPALAEHGITMPAVDFTQRRPDPMLYPPRIPDYLAEFDDGDRTIEIQRWHRRNNPVPLFSFTITGPVAPVAASSARRPSLAESLSGSMSRFFNRRES